MAKRRKQRRAQRRHRKHKSGGKLQRPARAAPSYLITMPLPGAPPGAGDDCPICKALGIDPDVPGGTVTPISSVEDLEVLRALMEHMHDDDPASA